MAEALHVQCEKPDSFPICLGTEQRLSSGSLRGCRHATRRQRDLSRSIAVYSDTVNRAAPVAAHDRFECVIRWRKSDGRCYARPRLVVELAKTYNRPEITREALQDQIHAVPLSVVQYGVIAFADEFGDEAAAGFVVAAELPLVVDADGFWSISMPRSRSAKRGSECNRSVRLLVFHKSWQTLPGL
jgi:hypothetical protein